MRISDTAARVLVAIPLAILAVLLVVAGGWVFALGVTIAGCICLHEYYDLFASKRPLRLAGFVGMVGTGVAAALGGATAVLLVAWAMLPLVFLLVVARPNMEGAGDAIISTTFGIWWIAGGLGQAILLRKLDHGAGVVLISLIAIFACDIAAYFGGRSFGKRPLAPRVSPRKTVEGLLAGIAGALLAAVGATLYAEWLGFGQAVAIGIVVAVFAPLGDLFESLLKRDAGAKDTARILGPHGGLLDRIDGVLFAIVGVYWLWSAIG